MKSAFILLALLPFYANAQTLNAKADTENRIEEPGVLEKTPLMPIAAEEIASIPLHSIEQIAEKSSPNILSANQIIEDKLAQQQWQELLDYLARYRQIPQHDAVLADFAEAAAWRGLHHHAKALPLYQRILATHDDYVFVRLAYAQTLFIERMHEAAEAQFLSIDLDKVLPPTAAQIRQYLAAIAEQRQAKINVFAHVERNNNINQAGEATDFTLNGMTLHKTEDSLPQTGYGIRYQTSINRYLWGKNRHQINAAAAISGIHYLGKPSQYNEQTVHVQTNYQHRGSRHPWLISPFYEYSRYQDQSYANSYGIRLNYVYRPTINLYWRFNHSLRFSHHHQQETLNGIRHQSEITLGSLKPNRHLYSNLTYNQENPNDASLHNYRLGLGIGFSYLFQNGSEPEFYTHYSKRQFKLSDGFIKEPREDNEWLLRLGISHHKLQYKGIRPILYVEQQQIRSNRPNLYNRREHKFYIELQKIF